MRVTITVPDEIGEEVRQMAEEKGTSVSGFYAAAAAEEVNKLRRKRAFEAIDRLIGTTEIAPDALAELRRMRQESDRSFS